jgi:acid phosphatase family membrane protein YuiD
MNIPLILASVVAALATAQGLKLLHIAFRHHLHLRMVDLVVTGGMPSTHCAIVTALCLSILGTDGWRSTNFIVAAVLAIIVIRDALGVRRTAGDEGRTINAIIRLAHVKTPPVHYSLGHTPSEVAVGIVIGALVTLLVTLGIPLL